MDSATLIAYCVMAAVTASLGWVLIVLFRPQKEVEANHPASRKDNQLNNGADKTGKNKKGKNVANSGPAPESEQKLGKRQRKNSINLDRLDLDEIHPWQAAVWKGHSGNITDLDWSSNDKFIASCAEDRTILIWLAKDVLTKDRRSVRVNVPFDNARVVSWSPDSTAFIAALDNEKVLQVFKLAKKAEGAHVTVTPLTKFKKVHEVDIVGVGIACSGLYIMSCSRDGNLILWDVKGSVLERTSVDIGEVTFAKISYCGRYIAVCGNDCVIFEVKFDQMKDFQSIRTSGKLKGHESKVQQIDFSMDSNRIATVTENGFWRLFDTTGNRVNVICMGQAKSVPHDGDGFVPSVALSRDGRVVVVGYMNQMDIFEVALGSAVVSIAPSWTVPCDGITKVIFSLDGRYLLAASEKTVVVFHNVGGMVAAIRDLKKQYSEAAENSSLKTRVTSEIKTIIQTVPMIRGDDSLINEVLKFRDSLPPA